MTTTLISRTTVLAERVPRQTAANILLHERLRPGISTWSQMVACVALSHPTEVRHITDDWDALRDALSVKMDSLVNYPAISVSMPVTDRLRYGSPSLDVASEFLRYLDAVKNPVLFGAVIAFCRSPNGRLGHLLRPVSSFEHFYEVGASLT